MKDVARKLTPFAHHQTSSIPITNAITAGNNAQYIQKLDQHVGEAYELCSLLEICFMNGIRTREFQGIIPFWGLLERLAVTQNDNEQNTSRKNQVTFNTSVEKIALMTSLRTPLAKVRGWIRHVLNLRALDDCLQIILKDERLLNLFYTPDAILRHSDNTTIFTAVVRALKVLPFAFTVEDSSLNLSPSWTTALISAGGYKPIISQSGYSKFPPVIGRSAKSVGEINKKKSKGYISSFFSSMEKKINGVLESVDPVRNDDKKDIGKNYYGINSEENRGSNMALGLIIDEETNGQGQGEGKGKGRGYMVPLFGTSLHDLVLDEKRCGVSNIDPQLGIPNMILSILTFLTKHIQTPGLFQTTINMRKYKKLKIDFENERGVPEISEIIQKPDSPYNYKDEINEMVHLVSYSLLQWLSELPEPLLGITHYSAIEASLEVEQEEARIRNLSLLILEAPWYSQPLLSKLVNFLHLLLLVENRTNGLNIVSVSTLFTPFLFRRNAYLHIQVQTKDYPRVWGSFYSSLSFDFSCVERDDEARGLLVPAVTGKILTDIIYYLKV